MRYTCMLGCLIEILSKAVQWKQLRWELMPKWGPNRTNFDKNVWSEN